MAYKPKYSKSSGRTGAAGVLFGLLTAGVALVSLAVTGLLLNHIFLHTGNPKPQAGVTAPDMALMEDFSLEIGNIFLGVQDSFQTPSQEGDDPGAEVTQPTEPKKTYVIPADAQVAPEPNQSCFGQSTDPAVLREVIGRAAELLEGQELYFDPEVTLFPGSTVNYYLDETIFAITWKEVHSGCVYTFSEVKIAHPSQLRRHLSDGEYGSGKLYHTTEMAATVNAVVASSGDFYANRKIFGVVAYEGEVRRGVDDKYAETCYIDGNGDMIFSYMGQLKGSKNAQAFVDEIGASFSLSFGPILVDNYEVPTMPAIYGVGEIANHYARAGLCQMDTLHYLVATANTEGAYGNTPTVAEFQKVIAATGCRMAYCLDGGQTAAIVMNDTLINRPVYGQQRRISDIIYFATAIPEGG